MKLTNPSLFYLFLVFVVLNVVDLITAWFIIPGEANPIFLLTGNMLVIDIIKILFVLAIWYYYRRNIYPSHMMYYIIVLILVLGSLVMGLGVYSNIIGIIHPEVLEAVSQMTKTEKLQGYFTMTIIFYFLPFGFSLIAFWLYERSLNCIKVNKKFFKERKWWQP